MAEQTKNEKVISTRIALKIDTYENWTSENLGEGKGAKFVLKRGEIGLCEIKTKEQGAQTAPTVLFKVGSVYPEGHEKAGQLIPFKELPWASALAADVYGWAKASDVVLDGKKIKFVGTNKEIDLANFALTSDLTDAVGDLTAADTALDDRIDAIEAKLGIVGEGKDLATQIADAVKAEENARKAADLALEAKIGAASVPAVGEEGAEGYIPAKAATGVYVAIEKAQGEVDALEIVVNNLSGTVSSNDLAVKGLISDEVIAREDADKAIKDTIGAVAEGKTVVKMISDAQTAAEAKVTELSNGQVKTNKADIATIKGDYLTSTDKGTLEAADLAILGKIGTVADGKTVVGLISEAQTAAQDYADTKAGDVQTNLTNHINNTYSKKVQELVTEDARIAELVSTEEQDRKDAIDTVTSEIERVEGLVTTEQSRAEGVEKELRGLITGIQDNIASGLHFVGVVEKLEDITSPVNGDICIIGTQEYIYVKEENKAGRWEPLGEANAHAAKTYVDGELAKKADKDIYEAKVAELAGEDKVIREAFAKADADLKSELQGNIDGKVAQGDFDTLEGRVDGHDTAIAAKLDSSVYEAHITAYNNKVGELESKDTELAGKISAIETSLSTGDIHTEIDGVRTLAQKGVDDAAAVDGRVTTLSGTVEGISTELAGVKATANAAAVKETVEAEFQRVDGVTATLATKETVNGIDGRLSTVEGKVSTVEGKVSTLEGKVSTLEGTYTNEQVDSAISTAVAGEAGLREAADTALSNRVKVFEDKFGGAEDILIFDCGSSTEVI